MPRAPAAAPFLAVCGHTNLDVQLRLRELPRAGQSTPVLERRTVRGGTACNIARHAGCLGVPVRLWSRVGDDFPQDWRDALEADGVDLAHLDVVAGGRTPTCYVLTDAEEEQAFCMDQGPMQDMARHPPGPAILDGLGGWLHLATGDPHAYLEIAQAARKRGIPVALDPGQELRFMYDARALERLLDHCDVLFLNRYEADVACGLLGYGDPVQILDHVDALVLTLGREGADLHRAGRKRLRRAALPVERVVDPTGAGDALRAGWYAALHAGRAMEEALEWGQAAAAVAVQHPGPQTHPIRRGELDALRVRAA